MNQISSLRSKILDGVPFEYSCHVRFDQLSSKSHQVRVHSRRVLLFLSPGPKLRRVGIFQNYGKILIDHALIINQADLGLKNVFNRGGDWVLF